MGALRAGFHGTVGQPSAQVIEGSLRFDSTKKQYLKRTPSSVGNQKTFTLSGWFKLSSISSNREFLVSGTSNSERTRLIFSVSDAINFYNRTSNTVHDDDSSAALFRDTSSFYHVVISIDNSNTTGTFYVNGESVHTFSTVNTNSYINSTTIHYIGGQVFNDNNYYNGYISQLYLIDGQALGPEYFGFTDPLTNTWRPKKYEGKLAKHTVPSGYTYWDGMDQNWSSGGTTSSGNDYINYALPSDTKVYWEVTVNDPALYRQVGISENAAGTGTSYTDNLFGFYMNDVSLGPLFMTKNASGTSRNGSVSHGSRASVWNDGDTIMWAWDPINDGIYFGLNGTWYGGGDPANGINPAITGEDLSAASFYFKQGRTDGNPDTQTHTNITSSNATYFTNVTETTIGVNSFYLPMDGNSPIGQDKSGNGNDWTPIGFGGSVELLKATGALPILKTNEAGTVAKLGARTDRKSYTVTASGGRYYLDGTEAPILNAYRGGSYTFDYTGATSHPFYLSSLQDGKHNSEAYSVEFNGTTSSKYLSIDDTADLRLGTGDWTIEEFVYIPTGTTMPNYWVNSLCIGGESNSEVGASIYHTSLAGGNDNSVAGGVSYIGPSNSYRLFHRIDTRGRWVHIAVTRESGTVRLFVDGNLSDSIADTTDYNGTSGSKIGVGNISQSNYLNGKVSNVRVVKGQALYTSNFTPPSTTLTTTSQGAIASNVKLLCCQDNDPTNATVIPTGSTISNNNGTAAVNSSPFLYDINGYYGVNTATTNTTKITIPHWAPDTLYYYCNVHSGMGSSINVTTDISKADPYAWKNVLALPLAGGTGDVSNQFNVESTTKVTTANGGVTSSGQSNFYGSSYIFDATDDYISIPTNSDFRFGYHDWTIECWHYSTKAEGGTSTNTLMSIWNTSDKRSWLLNLYGSRFRAYFSTTGGASPNIYEVTGGSSYPVKANRWYHVAAVKEGNNFHLFQDGVLVDTRSDVVDLPSFENTTDELRIGARNDSTNFTNGSIQDVRIYKGVAKYTGTTEGVQYFVPASTNPDVLPDTPSGVSGGSKLTKITEGAVSIPGTTDYLVVSDSTDLELGGDEFTIEAYINPTGAPGGSGYNCIFAKGESLQCYFMSNGAISLYASTDYTANNYDIIQNINATGLGSVSLNKWTHLAVCRSAAVGPGDTWKIFVDGVEKYTGNHTGTIENNAYGFSIGDYSPSSGTYEFQGYISNFRVVKGTALYTSDFTPPTEPLTNVTNTKLLCCQSNNSASVAAVTPNVPGSGINDGTIWSANVSASTGYIVDAGLGFDGSTSTAAYASSSASDTYIYIDFSTALSGTFKLWTGMASGSPTATVTHSGGSSSVSLSSGENSLGTFTSVTRIAVNRGEAATHSFQAIAVDGVQLLDPIAVGGETSATNFNPFTDDINAIRGQETGYATLNPLALGDNITLSEGNLKASEASTSGHTWAKSNIGVTSGKWYVEIAVDSATGPNSVGLTNFPSPHTGWIGADSSAVNQFNIIYNNATTRQIFDANVATTNYISGAQWSVGDVLQIAYDADAGKAWFGINNIWYQANGTSTSSDDVASGNNATFVNFLYDSEYFFTTDHHDAAFTYNFGQKPFKFPPPDGFQSLNAANLRPETVIARPDQYVGVTTYTGDTDPNHTISVGLKPDLVWIKSRDASRNHRLTDTVRGAGKELYTDISNSEGTVTDGVTSFTDNGFVLGANNNYNYTEGYVAWTWKAGGDKNTFNIDDVGYANASDVNMSVGSLNSVSYDKSSTWSSTSGMSSPTNAFDGSFSTGAVVNSSGSPVTVTTDSFTASSISFYKNGNNDQITSITINDTSTFNFPLQSTAEGWVTVDLGSEITVTSLKTTWYGNYTLYAVKADTKLLVDNGTTTQDVPSTAATGCSVGTKQGFSIVAYEGTSSANSTIPHGLTKKPQFILAKNRDSNFYWHVYHADMGHTKYAEINESLGYFEANANYWKAEPTDNVFSIGIANALNADQDSIIAYLWHDVPGLQKFGIYEGNADANGSYVELGFKPAILMLKNADAAEHWYVYDSERSSYNPAYQRLLWSSNTTEENSNVNARVDLLSSGFKLRQTNAPNTANTYIYAAWAETPAVNLYGGQSNAR